MEIKVSSCRFCPFGHMEWDLDFDNFKVDCSLELESNTSIVHFGRIKNINKHKFNPPKDCKLKQEKEIIVNFGV